MKLCFIWVWINPSKPAGMFTTQSPEEVRARVLEGDSLLLCTERKLTACFRDEYGWCPKHPGWSRP